MSRDKNQTEARMLRYKPAEDLLGVLFLGFLRAAREKDNVIFSNTGELAQRSRSWVVAIGLRTVVLKRSGDNDTLRWSTKCAKAVGRFVVLSGEQVDLPQHGRNEWANAAVAGKAVVAHPAVRDRDFCA